MVALVICFSASIRGAYSPNIEIPPSRVGTSHSVPRHQLCYLDSLEAACFDREHQPVQCTELQRCWHLLTVSKEHMYDEN